MRTTLIGDDPELVSDLQHFRAENVNTNVNSNSNTNTNANTNTNTWNLWAPHSIQEQQIQWRRCQCRGGRGRPVRVPRGQLEGFCLVLWWWGWTLDNDNLLIVAGLVCWLGGEWPKDKDDGSWQEWGEGISRNDRIPVIIWRLFTQYTGGVGFYTSQVPQPLFLDFFNASQLGNLTD